MTELQSNPQLELAYEYVCHTNKNIFLTGKAGTGKTTFLHRIKHDPVKRMAIVAPTGVAAINAGGMTIHSLFQLPFGPYVPGSSRDTGRQQRFNSDKIRLIKSLDLLVIDEISMVRADLLDGIDDTLRRYRNPYEPFGGVQLLMIGDLHQLPPVVKDEEWNLLRPYYATPYFFSSRALQQAGPVVIKLIHIYRQSDDTFINLLNLVRDNRMSAGVLDTLNSRFIPDFQPDENEGYITLTTHNASAKSINAEKLAAAPGKLYRFAAKITDDFPAHAYPTDPTLELKTGAQVMFVKNDNAADKRFYNGKIGRITRIRDESIEVQCPGDERPITVSPMEWENIRYTLNEQTKEVTETVAGTFTQLPLKLAWAITIHKSQGLTFERVLLDAQAAFAHGQVYVALSRCKSFEGIVLRSKIDYSSVRTDSTVQDFSETADKYAPDEAHLEASKIAFQQSLILDLFSFNELRKYIDQLKRVLLEHENTLHPEALRRVGILGDKTAVGLLPVAETFRSQLMGFFQQAGLPEQHAALQTRIGKGAAWFSEFLEQQLKPEADGIQIITDNKTVRQAAQDALTNLQKELFVKPAGLKASKNGFPARDYLRLKADAELDFQATRSARQSASTEAPRDLPHPKLYARLIAWRRSLAELHGVEDFEVLPGKVIQEIIRVLPTTLRDLKKIKGIGKVKSGQYGADLAAIVELYCTENRVAGSAGAPLPLPAKAPKPDTKEASFALYKAGKSIDEIAVERGFIRSTIEGHLAHYVGSGQLDISEILPAETVERIGIYFRENPSAATAEAKAHFGETYSYGEIRMVRAWIDRSAAENEV